MDIVTRLEHAFPILQSGEEAEVTELQSAAITFITYLLEQCQERGAFSLDQAVQIKIIIDRMRNGEEKNVDLPQQKQDLASLFEGVENANNKGKLNLKEAHLAYMSIQCFIFQKNDTI